MNIKKQFCRTKTDKGFTIIELMIATLVFSTVLVLLTTGVIYFTNSYRKGVILSTTQNAARQITDNISQAVQYSSSSSFGEDKPKAANGDVGVLCIGSKRYTYVLKKQISSSPQSGQVYNALVADTLTTPCNPMDPIIPQFGANKVGDTAERAQVQELIGQRMRLVELKVEPIVGADDVIRITVAIAYGDEDLFERTGPDPNFSKCSAGKGSQFCGTAKLVTTVQRRIQ